MKALCSFLALLAFALPAFAEAPSEEGFQPLFNGKDTTGWHIRREGAHSYWKVENGVLKNELAPGEHGVDLLSDKTFWNFTVRYEFMVPDGSNSGFYLRGRQEIQILGDFATGKPDIHGNGAIYSFKAPDAFISKPGGEWQTAEVTIIGHKITATINGQKVHDAVECLKPTGSEIDGNMEVPGPFFLQGDHGTVSFRNLRVKELPKE